MKFEPLSMYCECGRAASTFTQVGLTDDHQMVFHWWCPDCDEPVHMFKSLAECWRECPHAEDTAAPEAPNGSNTASEDLILLAAMGIALPEDGIC